MLLIPDFLIFVTIGIKPISWLFSLYRHFTGITFVAKQAHVMIENTVYMGVNAPKVHQRIIGQLMMRLGMLHYIEKKIPYW